MFNNNGPSMKPSETLKISSDHELYVPFNFTFSFLSLSMSALVLKKGHLAWTLAINNSWGKQSKALEKSVSRVSKPPSSSRNFIHF